ncbi:hypothetical protein ACOMHN_007807 [Nucella lapillus]
MAPGGHQRHLSLTPAAIVLPKTRHSGVGVCQELAALTEGESSDLSLHPEQQTANTPCGTSPTLPRTRYLTGPGGEDATLHPTPLSPCPSAHGKAGLCDPPRVPPHHMSL